MKTSHSTGCKKRQQSLRPGTQYRLNFYLKLKLVRFQLSKDVFIWHSPRQEISFPVKRFRYCDKSLSVGFFFKLRTITCDM